MKGKIALTLATVFALGISVSAATLPAGTNVTVRTGATLSSKTARSGRTIPCSVARDVVVHGQKLAKVGDRAKCRVTSAKSSGRLHAPGVLSIRLAEVNGQHVATGSHTFKGKSHKKSNVTKIGGGAAAGALIGGLAGGGKGALIGTAAGGAAGTGVAVATGKEEAVVPAETAMTFTIRGASKQSR
ncbi:MAG: hypothetical protein DMG61_02320 [Acidobacteria bacterium]|nr:MAG: hypothetical protein DMG61_02320 [Acidobacteriota bacterium]